MTKAITHRRLSSWQRADHNKRGNMKGIERFNPISAFDDSDRTHIICWIAATLILTYWIMGRIQPKPHVKDIVPGEAPLPRVYINDSNRLTRFLDPLVAFSRGPELLKAGYKLVIGESVSN